MTVSSGVRPYAYNRDQFTLQVGEKIGYSGILFEEPMFTLTAERAIYKAISASDRKFTKYINKDAAVSADFEPRADGGNLDGQYANPSLSGADAGPGNVAFKDYIVDLRTALSGLLMTYIPEDVDYSGVQILEDYFLANQLPGPDGTSLPTWTHPDDSTSPSGLAVSGALYDIDLREVQYQPYTRASKFVASSGGNQTFVMPITPSFMSKTGGMVRVSALDKAHANNIIISDLYPGVLGSGYAAADLDKFLVMGDGFTTANSKIRIGYDLEDLGKLDASATGDCTSVLPRRLLEDMGNNGFGQFSAPSVTLNSGIYGFQVFDDAGKSGLLGIWPPIPNWRNVGFNAYGYKFATGGIPVMRASGIHVFNEGMWSPDSSGMILCSPINGDVMWRRFAENDTYQTSKMITAQNWGTDTPNNDPGSSTTLTVLTLINFPQSPPSQTNPPLKDEYFIFATYNKRTGALLSSTESGPFVTNDPSFPVHVAGTMENHVPHDGGISLGGYTYCNTREGSDFFTRVIITDGINPRGAIIPSGNWGTAISVPEFVGTIGGRLMGASTIHRLHSPHRMYGLVVDQARPIYPLPVSSGKFAAAVFHADSNGPYEIMMEQELGHSFESLINADFSPANNNRIIQGQGDFVGNDYMLFNAKPFGNTNQYQYLGRVEIATSGVKDIVKIMEMLGPFGTVPAWIDDFTS